MKKIDLLTAQIETIKKFTLIKCIFTDNIIYKEEDNRINLYLYLNKTEFDEIYRNVSGNLINYNVIMYDEIIKYENYHITQYYYENSLSIKIVYLFDYSYVFKNNIISLYDPYNLIENFKIEKLTLTNKEFALAIESFCKSVYDCYNFYIQNDLLAAYSKAKLVQDDFVLIYRGFYDSINAKKSYNDTKNINVKFYENLLKLIKTFKYDSIIENIQLMVNEIDKMINQLPVNIITLFNFDFYTFTRKLIFSL